MSIPRKDHLCSTAAGDDSVSAYSQLWIHTTATTASPHGPGHSNQNTNQVIKRQLRTRSEPVRRFALRAQLAEKISRE